jgi:hypothetical protein
MPATKPVSVGSYLFGVFAGALTAYGLAAIDGIGRGEIVAGFMIIAAPLLFPVYWIGSATLGTAAFVLLRRTAPVSGPSRFIVITAILAPIVFFLCLVGWLWIDGLSDYSPYFPSPKPPLTVRAEQAFTGWWRMMLSVVLIGGVAAWAFDQKALFVSENPVVRRTARSLLAGFILTCFLAVVLVLTCHQLVVAYRAQKIAGERPYCILVPSYDDRQYETATRRSQLSFTSMRAGYSLRGGVIRGGSGYYTTDHALLVLDDPREYLNWSYRSEDFVREALINTTGGIIKGRKVTLMLFNPCEPKPHFIDDLE